MIDEHRCGPARSEHGLRHLGGAERIRVGAAAPRSPVLLGACSSRPAEHPSSATRCTRWSTPVQSRQCWPPRSRTAPPLVLLGSTEGLSLLVKVRRRPTLTYWAALAMTLLLALAAFRLSFDALRDLAVLCGLRPSLAWLWPLVVDVTITQATVSLLALSRQEPHGGFAGQTARTTRARPVSSRWFRRSAN